MFLGRAHYRHRLNVPLEEHLLVMSPPRMLKTAFLADVILRYPGPVLATSTKPDLYALTAMVRSQQGPVHVFNPQRIGGVPSTFRWNPVEGCQDPATAIRRADAFAFAVSHKGVEDGSFWSAKASDYLRGYFHAAALAQYDLRAVAAWVSGADPEVPERILIAAGAHQWAQTLAELRSEAHKTTATVRMVMCTSPGLHGRSRTRRIGAARPRRRVQHPRVPLRHRHRLPDRRSRLRAGPGRPAVRRHGHRDPLRRRADRPGLPVRPPGPVAAAWASTRSRRSAQFPSQSWLADSGGKGIQVIAVVHGEAQLAERWGDHGRQIVLDTSSVKLFLPGITDTTTLQAASTLCGQASWKIHGQEHATRHDVATPDMIRQLPTAFALVIRSNCAPVITRLPQAWKNPAYRRARRLGHAPARPLVGGHLPPGAGPARPSPITCPPTGSPRRRRRHRLPLELT